MTKKIDRKALIRQSRDDVDKDPVARRFDVAEATMGGRTQGLLSPEPSPSFRAETSSAPADGRLLRVAIDRVHDNPMNARQIYDPEVIKDLASSVATRGQLVPAPAIAHPTLEGHYILIDGHYRKRALVAAGKHEIDCQLHVVTGDLELYKRSFLINEERSSQSPLDNAISWRRLLDAELLDSADAIGEMLGVSKGYVAKTMALLKLPERALDKIRETPGKFGLSIGYEISRCASLMEEDELLELMDRVVRDDLSSRQVEAFRANIEARPNRKQKEMSRQYRLKDGKGVIKAWSSKVSLEVRVFDPREREALVEELKQRFGLDEGVADTATSGKATAS